MTDQSCVYMYMYVYTCIYIHVHVQLYVFMYTTLYMWISPLSCPESEDLPPSRDGALCPPLPVWADRSGHLPSDRPSQRGLHPQECQVRGREGGREAHAAQMAGLRSSQSLSFVTYTCTCTCSYAHLLQLSFLFGDMYVCMYYSVFMDFGICSFFSLSAAVRR